MSLSKPKLTNPCKKFIEFKGDSGIFQYWDKVAEKNVEIPKPFSFIVLDELSTITGFSDEYQCGIFSNEVHSLLDEPLSVRTFKGRTRIVGKYTDIKKDVAAIGGKFCKSVYAALIKSDNTLELVNFQLKGIAFKSWMDAVIDKSSFAVKVEDCGEGKKGKVEFKIPNYKQADLPRDLLEKAVAMDKDLQVFLKEKAQSQEIREEVERAPVEQEEAVPF
jgi:hypothetical protein